MADLVEEKPVAPDSSMISPEERIRVLEARIKLLEDTDAHKVSPPFCNMYQCDIGNKFLNTMKNTHEKFPLGAAAELIDNSREAAKEAKNSIQPLDLRIDKELGGRALSFTDNGTGMDYRALYSMLKPGMGTKGCNNFGQGFKTGTMGLGGEAVVLTNDGTTRSLAFLSRSTNKLDADIIEPLCIPFAFWHPDGQPATRENPLPREEQTRGKKSSRMAELIEDVSVEKEVLCHIFNSRGTAIPHFGVLQEQFRKIERGGTRILVWQLHRKWSFDDDDIAVPDSNGIKFIREDRHGINIPAGVDVPPDYSLWNYCQILFLQSAAYSKFRIFIRGKEVLFKDPMSPIYVSDFKEYPLELKSRGIRRRPVTLRLTLAFSPEDDREGRFGCHVYWNDTQSDLWRRLRLAPRLVQPYTRQGTQDCRGIFNGVLARLELSPEVIDVHNGKQTFDLNSSPDNWRLIEEALNRALHDFHPALEAARGRSVMRQLAEGGFVYGAACWAVYSGDNKWHPAKLLNRFDLAQELSPDLLASKEWAALAEDRESVLVEWFDGGYGIVPPGPATLRPWSRACPHPARRGGTDAAAKKAEAHHAQLVADVDEWVAECSRCHRARRLRGAEPLADGEYWTCDRGFLGAGDRRAVGCDVPEVSADRAAYDDEHGAGRAAGVPPDAKGGEKRKGGEVVAAARAGSSAKKPKNTGRSAPRSKPGGLGRRVKSASDGGHPAPSTAAVAAAGAGADVPSKQGSADSQCLPEDFDQGIAASQCLPEAVDHGIVAAAVAAAAAAAEMLASRPPGAGPLSGVEATDLALKAFIQAAVCQVAGDTQPAHTTAGPDTRSGTAAPAAAAATADDPQSLAVSSAGHEGPSLTMRAAQPRAGSVYLRRNPPNLSATAAASTAVATQRAGSHTPEALTAATSAGSSSGLGTVAVERVLDLVWALRVCRGGEGGEEAKGKKFLDLDCGQSSGSWRICGADGSGTDHYIGADCALARLGKVQERCRKERPKLKTEWMCLNFRSGAGLAELLDRSDGRRGFVAVGLRAPLVWEGAQQALDLMLGVCGLLQPGGCCFAVAINCDAVVEQFKVAGSTKGVAFGPIRATADCGTDGSGIALDALLLRLGAKPLCNHVLIDPLPADSLGISHVRCSLVLNEELVRLAGKAGLDVNIESFRDYLNLRMLPTTNNEALQWACLAVGLRADAMESPLDSDVYAALNLFNLVSFRRTAGLAHEELSTQQQQHLQSSHFSDAKARWSPGKGKYESRESYERRPTPSDTSYRAGSGRQAREERDYEDRYRYSVGRGSRWRSRSPARLGRDSSFAAQHRRSRSPQRRTDGNMLVRRGGGTDVQRRGRHQYGNGQSPRAFQRP